MPHHAREIRETHKTILRPVLLQVAADLLQWTRLDQERNITYLGFAKQLVSKGSTPKSKKAGVKFPSANKLSLEAQVEFNPDGSLSEMLPYNCNVRPIFFDKSTRIMLSPVPYEKKVAMNFQLRTEDRLTAESWIALLRRKVGQGLRQEYHRLEYHYPIDKTIIKLLQHLFTLKLKGGGAEATFEDWLDTFALETITTLANQKGSAQTLVVKQTQLAAHGVWQIEPVPTMEKGETGDTFVCAFSYTFRFEMPTTLTLQYPITVYNSLIDKDYRGVGDHSRSLVLGAPGKLLWGLDAIRPRDRPDYVSTPIIFPDFDDWRPEQLPMKTATLYSALIVVDPDDPCQVMNLFRLGQDYQLAPWLMMLMTLFFDQIAYPGHAPVTVSLYRNEHWCQPSDLALIWQDQDLHLRSVTPMALHHYYHVRLALLTDLTLLSERALALLMTNGAICQCLLATLGPDLYEQVPPLLSSGAIAKPAFWDFVRQLRNTNPHYKNGIEIRRFSVGRCLVLTEEACHAPAHTA